MFKEICQITDSSEAGDIGNSVFAELKNLYLNLQLKVMWTKTARYD